MKTPDKIKKGLENCTVGRCGEECPYFTIIDMPFGDELGCDDSLLPDALAYIKQLEADKAQLLEKIKQLEQERDAAIKDIPRACGYCKHYAHKKTHLCSNKYPCAHVSGENTRWEWRGVQEGGEIG